MRLTPADVERMTFSTALRGYDLNEVDDFLDRVVVTMRELDEELTEAQSQRGASSRPDTSSSQDASVVGRALVAAQQAADGLIEEANAEAARILELARTAADTIESERDARRQAAEEEIELLGERVSAVRNQLAMLATEVADRLDAMDETLSGALKSDQTAVPAIPSAHGADVTHLGGMGDDEPSQGPGDGVDDGDDMAPDKANGITDADADEPVPEGADEEE
jgi:cell division initiation protein